MSKERKFRRQTETNQQRIQVPANIIRLCAAYEVEELSKVLPGGAIAVLLCADPKNLPEQQDAINLLHAQLKELEVAAAYLRDMLTSKPVSPHLRPS